MNEAMVFLCHMIPRLMKMVSYSPLISVFFHFSSISTQPGMVVYLLPQQICEFELVKGPRGYLAKNVTSEHKTQSHGQKSNDIYYHYYHSFRKIMSKMIEDEIDKMKEDKKC